MSETKTALVTGANKGIGYEIAAGLGARGYRVGVGARDEARLGAAVDKLRADGVDAFGVPLEVTDDRSATDAAALVERQAGGLDVLVNNAGIHGGDGREAWGQDPTTLDLDLVRRVFETNVIGVIRVTNAMLPMLRRSASPRIVNASSTVASLTLQADPDAEVGPVMAAYSPTKTHLNALTVHYARQLADTNILINAADPGLVSSDFTGFQGFYTPEEGAVTAIRLAMLPDDGPSGAFFGEAGPLPW